MTIAVTWDVKQQKQTNTSYKNDMIGHGGEGSQNAQNHFSIKMF